MVRVSWLKGVPCLAARTQSGKAEFFTLLVIKGGKEKGGAVLIRFRGRCAIASMSYYISNNDGKVQGPYPLDTLKSLLASGSITLATQVCEKGTETWERVSSVLPPVQAARPPSPATAPIPASPQPTHADPPSQRSRVFLSEQEHLADIRSRSCYKTLRFVITFSALVGIAVAVAIPLVPLIWAAANGSPRVQESEWRFALLITLGIIIGECILIIATRQMMLLFVDIADTLIFDHNRKRNR